MDSYLPNSVYGWACYDGPAGNGEVTASERLIGWLTLVFQGITYILIIKESGEPLSDVAYSVVSVTAAMYLLVTTASPDLTVGYSLLVNGSSPKFRVFGAALLVVFGLMVTAAMRLLFSGSEDNANVVANSVTVLFIADLDEKALSFFKSVPQNWRLFWAMELMSISFCLALAGVVFVGDVFTISDPRELSSSYTGGYGNFDGFDVFRIENMGTWFIFWVNPAVGTFFAYACSHLLQRCLIPSQTNGDGLFVVKLMWFLIGCFSWVCDCIWMNHSGTRRVDIFPYAVAVDAESSDSWRLVLSVKNISFVVSNTALFLGLAILAVRFIKKKLGGGVNSGGSSTTFAFPSLLVGWGLGYWAGSLLNALMWFWPGSILSGGALVVTICSLAVVPFVLFVGVFMIADAAFLGMVLEPFIRPAAAVLKNPDGVLYWTAVTILRDAVCVWAVVMIVNGYWFLTVF